MTARSLANLEKVRSEILNETPSAQVYVAPADVRDTQSVAGFVRGAVETFGRVDIVIANAGAVTPITQLLADKDADAFWNTFEVNLKGVYNVVRAAMPHLLKTKGRIIAVGSNGGLLRFRFSADYGTSKFALLRLVEYIALEYPDIKVFVLHPGVITTTEMASKNFNTGPEPISGIIEDTIALPTATILYFSAGKADWLNGRYVSACWDLSEVERDWKEKILRNNSLVCKLAIP